MSREFLKQKLINDLSRLFLPVNEFDLEIRPFSSSFYGKYTPKNFNNKRKKATIWIYPYSNKSGDMYSYCKILKTAIHEVCHHLQYTDPDYTRRKGIMHNSEFYYLMDKYVKRAEKYEIIDKEGYLN